MKKGAKYLIHGYKHNGKIYKIWDEAVFLDETKDYYVFANNNTKVTKRYGKSWRTKEEAVMFFFKDEWFNVIAQLKPNGIYFYCNIASPVVIEKNVIKYIDYDLDLRIYPDKTYRVLDELEYEYHKRKMKYSSDLDKIIRFKLNKLIEKYKDNDEIFSKELVEKYAKEYFKLKKIKKN